MDTVLKTDWGKKEEASWIKWVASLKKCSLFRMERQNTYRGKCCCIFEKQSPSIILGSSFLRFGKQEVTYTRHISHCCFKDIHPVMFSSVVCFFSTQKNMQTSLQQDVHNWINVISRLCHKWQQFEMSQMSSSCLLFFKFGFLFTVDIFFLFLKRSN